MPNFMWIYIDDAGSQPINADGHHWPCGQVSGPVIILKTAPYLRLSEVVHQRFLWMSQTRDFEQVGKANGVAGMMLSLSR